MAVSFRIPVTVALWASLTAPLGAQSDLQPAFDVASVKPNKSGGPGKSNFPLGPGDAYNPNGGFFSTTNFPLASYIAFAYKLMGSQLQYLQLPGWVMEERYDIQARAVGNPTKDQMRLMMRALLAERFKLAMHSATREGPVAALTVLKEGKLGPRLRAHPADSPCPLDAAPPSGANSGVVDGYPTLCGGLLMLPPDAPGRLRAGARNVTMPFIANVMTSLSGLGRPVVDHTGLTGNFDFVLEWTPDLAAGANPGAEPPPDTTGPGFEQALREQLGLKLESQKGSVPVFVLDHVERPTEN
jgi:uncharacterized protein (TIGR03435 family)